MVRFKCSMHTVLLLLSSRHFFFIFYFLPFALHLFKRIKLVVHYSLTNTNTILFQPPHLQVLHFLEGTQRQPRSDLHIWRLSVLLRQLLLPSDVNFNLYSRLQAVLFPLSMSPLSDNSSKASFTASFRPRNLEKELSWVVISFGPFASIISLYSLPWEREDEKTSRRKISCEPKREIKNKIKQSKKYETINSGQYIICVLVWAEELSGFMQLYCVLGGHPFQLIKNNLWWCYCFTNDVES